MVSRNATTIKMKEMTTTIWRHRASCRRTNALIRFGAASVVCLRQKATTRVPVMVVAVPVRVVIALSAQQQNRRTRRWIASVESVRTHGDFSRDRPTLLHHVQMTYVGIVWQFLTLFTLFCWNNDCFRTNNCKYFIFCLLPKIELYITISVNFQAFL